MPGKLRQRAALAALLLATGAADILRQNEALAQTEKKPAASTKTAKPPGPPVPANIDRNGVMILVRNALLALDQANKTGNYTVLRDIGSPAFQKNTAARLGEIFAAQRAQALDLAGVAVLDPQLTVLPQIETTGLLRMAGFFPSVPTQVNFELLFAPVDRKWRLFGISVNLSNGTPQAPANTTPTEYPPYAEKPDPPQSAITVTPAPKPKTN